MGNQECMSSVWVCGWMLRVTFPYLQPMQLSSECPASPFAHVLPRHRSSDLGGFQCTTAQEYRSISCALNLPQH